MFIRKLINKKSKSSKEPDSLQYKLHLSHINPEPVFDLSNCNIKSLPKGIYSQCRVFRKHWLILRSNKLTEIPDNVDNRLDDLTSCITLLDVSYNQIKCLPSNLGSLSSLKELNISNNLISAIPESFTNLKSLETINISYNKLNQFPRVLCNLINLVCIDISNNQISQLPMDICKLTKLKSLQIDNNAIKNPPKQICDQGAEGIKFFYSKQHANDDDNLLDMEKFSSQNKHDSDSEEESPSGVNFQAYLAKKDDQKKKFIEFERNLLKETSLLEAAGRKMLTKRQEILSHMKQEQLILHKDLEVLNIKRLEDKASLIKALTLIEDHSKRLINQIKDFQARNKINVHIYPELDTDTNDQEDLIAAFETKLRNVIAVKDKTKESIQLELSNEEESLCQAIRNFVNMKSTQKRILSEQIAMIENELYHLTQAEIQKKSNNLEAKIVDISNHRTTLASLLVQLLAERDRDIVQKENSSVFADFAIFTDDARLNEIRKRDECLYQVLNGLDPSLINIYLPIILEKDITFNQLANSSEYELLSLGFRSDHIMTIQKNIKLLSPIEYQPATAPLLTENESSIEPSAPPLKLWYQIECVVCLDNESTIILLPCGHVCSCSDCSKRISSCPLCRNDITQKVVSIP